MSTEDQVRKTYSRLANTSTLLNRLNKQLAQIPDQIKAHTAAGDKHVYTLILTPRTSTLISQILEEEGVLGEITITSYNLQFIPLEEDVLSLEHENAFKEIWAVSQAFYVA